MYNLRAIGKFNTAWRRARHFYHGRKRKRTRRVFKWTRITAIWRVRLTKARRTK